MALKDQLYDALALGRSVMLVGTADAGKSWFMEHELLPFLRGKGLSVSYFSDCTKLSGFEGGADATVIEEVEVLEDKDVLEKNHPDERPYYTDEYFKKVRGWFEELARMKMPCVYVVTRNDRRDIDNFVKTVTKADWDGREVLALEFRR